MIFDCIEGVMQEEKTLNCLKDKIINMANWLHFEAIACLCSHLDFGLF